MTILTPPSADDVTRFRSMLAEFRWLSEVPRGDADRFQFLCDQMFTVFGGAGVWAAGREDDRLLPADDNLDTGNPSWHAPEPFMSSMLELVSDPENLRGYYGGFARDDLRVAVQDFLRREGLLAADQAVEVVAGAGTVHLYDLLCRYLVRRSNDVVLGAHPFYGFFLPHAERAGGQTRLLRPDDGYRCSPASVGASIVSINDELHRDWADTAEHRVVSFFTDAAPHLGVRPGRSWTMEVGRLIERVTAWPSQPERCDEEFATTVEPLLADVGLSWPNLTRVGRLPTVPRVVAWMHINPAQGGDVYRQDEVTALAVVLRANGVAPIEDLAYHSVRARLGELGSFFRTGLSTYQLLGLSKPFGLANCRVGLLVTDTGSGYQLGRLVENSAGWMPTFYQIALRDLLSSPDTNVYLRWNSSDSADSYTDRWVLARAALLGSGHDRAAPDEVVSRLRRVSYEVAAELVGAAGPAAGTVANARRLAEEFLDEGLSAWLSIPRPPEAGFFVMVDCTPLLESPLGRALHLRSAFDVFALLNHFVGVRTIPEEAMTVASLARGTKLLRLSFSVPTRTWVRACLLTFLRLRQLSEGSAVAADLPREAAGSPTSGDHG